MAPFDGSIWITFCSGLRRISRTSCSISGPTSTTIAPIPQWKGERRIYLRHDQSQISARFDGNLTVDPYIRHQWLRDFPKTLDRSGIRSTLGRLPIKSSGACALGCCALRGSDSFHSNRINSPETSAGRLGRVWRIVISQAAGHVTMLHPRAV